MKNQIFYIGSLPFTDPHRALQFVKENSPELPFLPQLPKANPKETMVAQALRGMQLGEWNKECSVCFESFLKDFRQSERLKIQVAGPLTVAWFSSKTFAEVEKTWMRMWKGVRKQIADSGFNGKVWLQLDEPIWSQQQQLPAHYDEFVDFLTGDSSISVGLHSCASERPIPSTTLMEKASFFSFDYLRSAMTAEEKLLWRGWLKKDRTLVVGIIDQKRGCQWQQAFQSQPEKGRVWMSASCGLFAWNEEDVERLPKNDILEKIREVQK